MTVLISINSLLKSFCRDHITYLPYHQSNSYHNPEHHKRSVFSQILVDGFRAQPAATHCFLIQVSWSRLGDLSSCPWAHWFFSHITDNCWMLWILSSQGRGEGLRLCVDTSAAIWFEECDILGSHWLWLTSVYFLSMVWVTAHRESCTFRPMWKYNGEGFSEKAVSSNSAL